MVDKVEVLWDNNTKEHTLKINFKLGIYEDTRKQVDNYKFEVKEGKNVVTLNGINSKKISYGKKDTNLEPYSTVTDLAKFLG